MQDQIQQLTQEQALAFYESGVWRDMSDEGRVKFQLFQDRLAMPFDVFQGAVEKVLGRPVYTHEFGSSGRLKEEYLGKRPAPTFQEIVELIPPDKRVLVLPTKP